MTKTEQVNLIEKEKKELWNERKEVWEIQRPSSVPCLLGYIAGSNFI